MKQKLIFTGIALIVFIACQANLDNKSTLDFKVKEFYSNAQLKMLENEPEQAIALLRQSLETGLQRPMQIVADSNFYPLIDNPNYRSEIRKILEAFAVENQAIMIRKNQQGEPIIIKGQIVEESNHAPLKNVKLELIHTDNDGFYFRENTKWNPQLFAYLVSDRNGEFMINTIRPGKYKDDEGNYIPSHIHFTLKKDSFRVYSSEFTFEDDSIFITKDNIEQIPVAKLINTKMPKQYHVTIPMQRE